MEPTVKSTPRDVFMYLLGIATLYWSSFNLIQLFLGFIDKVYPDPLNIYYSASGTMRWAIASLIIIYPVFVWISWFLNRDIKTNPAKAEIKIRKWLLYLTLFLAAILIIGDLVALIFNFLEGELTVRFLWKVFAVLAVAATVFGYYLSELRKKAQSGSSTAKMFAWIVSAVVLGAIIAGFMTAGSPFRQRLVRFDAERVNHLQQIQQEIVSYWQAKEKLPADLADLKNNNVSGFIVPVDPQTKAPYTYRATGPLTFELCAEFNLPDENTSSVEPRMMQPVYDPGVKPMLDAWEHMGGRQCYERTIDPDFYTKP